MDGVARTETTVVLSTHVERVSSGSSPTTTRCRRRTRGARGGRARAAHICGGAAMAERRTSWLQDPDEHDACGVGFVVNVKGERSHDIVQKGLTVSRT
jgi:hypothetical protein